MKTIIKENSHEIAKEVADKIISLVKAKPNCVLGLATGSTPIETYDLIIKRAKEENVDFSKVVTFNLDEYVNNPDFSQSYRFFMDEHLFNHINIDKKNTHFPSEENYKEYDKMIEDAGGVDFQILGIGSDAHIGFNEPGTSFSSLTHIAQLKESTIKDNSRFFKSIDDVPTSAITMGLESIMRSKEIALIALGANKAKAIKDSVSSISEEVPASILQRHENAFIYCDKEAAKLL